MKSGENYVVPLNAHELDREDPFYQEKYAVLELLRSLSIGKIVGVIGSGVTSVYGYSSWDAFIQDLVDLFKTFHDEEHLREEGKRLYERTLEKLEKKRDRISNVEYLSMIGQLACRLDPTGKERYLKFLFEIFLPPATYSQKQINEIAPQLFPDGIDRGANDASLPADLSMILSLLLPNIKGNNSKIFEPVNAMKRIRTPRNVIDPLMSIRKDLDISRFVTFNYDLEIERLLEDLDYPYNSLSSLKPEDLERSWQSRIGSVGRSISLNSQNSADLIALAAMPTAANDVVVHYHGSIKNRHTMIVTQADYNSRYFDEYAGRETFEDAQSLLFGGNSIVYIGVGLSEEDLMRPLRYIRGTKEKEKPIFALIPLLSTEKKARAMTSYIWENFGVNAIIYGRAYKDIPQVWRSLEGLTHPLGEDFCSLGEELECIEKAKTVSCMIELLNSKERAPRLNSAMSDPSPMRHVKSLLSMVGNPETTVPDPKVNSYLQTLATSIALNNILKYINNAASIWQRKLTKRHYPNHNQRKDHYGRTKFRPFFSEEINKIIEEGDTHYFNKVYDAIKKGNVSVLYMERGGGKGTFASYLSDRLEKDSIPSRIISIDRTMQIRTILIDTQKRIDKYQFICIQNADFLFDSSTNSTKTILMEEFLRFIKREENKSENKKILLLFRSKSIAENAAKTYDFWDINLNAAMTLERKMHRECILPGITEEKFPDLKGLLDRHRWANIFINGCLSLVCANGRSLKDIFLESCQDSLKNRLHGVDAKHEQSVLCEIALEKTQSLLQKYGNADERIHYVIQNIIMKWMYAIYIPVDQEVLRSIPEIIALRSKESYGLNDLIDAYVATAVEKMLECGIILLLNSSNDIADDIAQQQSDHDRKERYILHGSVRRYMAHKRGLSLEKADNRELNSVSVSPVLIDGGPMLSRDDYRSTCELYDSLIPKKIAPERRIVVRGAYALLRGNLYAQNAMRAGMAYSEANSDDSVLRAHLRRLAKLRSVYEAQVEFSKSNSSFKPSLHIHDWIWLLNEIGVVRFIQGNFHDCVLLFRESLKIARDDRQARDITLSARIAINLSLALVERARFEDSFSNLRLAEEDLLSLKAVNHPEHRLLSAVILGCKAQLYHLTAEIDKAQKCIHDALHSIGDLKATGARGWLHHIDASITTSVEDYDGARRKRAIALANARSSHRIDLILSLETSEVELELRASNFNRDSAIRLIGDLGDLEKKAARLGSHKICVSAMLIRGRALLTIEQLEPARRCIIDAICLAQHNGMRLKRISGLILMVALIAMRGEHKQALELLGSVKLAASRARYARALLDIEILEQTILSGGDIPYWAGYSSEFRKSKT